MLTLGVLRPLLQSSLSSVQGLEGAPQTVRALLGRDGGCGRVPGHCQDQQQGGEKSPLHPHAENKQAKYIIENAQFCAKTWRFDNLLSRKINMTVFEHGYPAIFCQIVRDASFFSKMKYCAT